MIRILFILVSITCFTQGLSAQSRGFKSYSVADGLAQSNVIDITEDKFGNLWLATFGGLSRFDGQNFENFQKQHGLASNRLFCLSIDSRGYIWMGTDKGVTKYDGRVFQNIPLPDHQSGQYVNQIHADKNDVIWIGTTSGHTYQWLDQELREITIDEEQKIGVLSGIAEDHRGLWITTFDGNLIRFVLDSIPEKIPITTLPENHEISSIFIDKKSNIWLGTTDGLFRSRGLDFEEVHLFDNGSPDFAIYSINQSEDGSIWLGTTHGAYKYTERGCYSIKATEGLTDNIVYKIHKDREGTLWFGTFGGGIFKSLGELFTYLGKDNGMPFDYISYIEKSSNGYWFGSYGGGVYHYQPAEAGSNYSIVNLSSKEGLCNDFVFALTEDANGHLWIATVWGLSEFYQNRFRSYYQQDGLPSNRVYDLELAEDGNIYAGTSKGLTIIYPGQDPEFETYVYPGAEEHNRIRSILQMPSGEVLLGTQGGLKIFDGKVITDYFQVDSLSTKGVSSLLMSKNGGLWCSLMDEGILYIDTESDSIRHYSEACGLSSNIVYSIALDAQGALWAGTPKGLDKVTFDRHGKIQTVRNFGADEGFFGIETNTNALLMDDDGSLWFGTVAGAYRCWPEKDLLNTFEPLTYLTDIQLFSQEVDWSQQSDSLSRWFNLPPNLNLAHNQNHVTFQFLGNSLKNPDKVRYQYILENFDRDWQPVTGRREAVYTNIPPGHYTFKVKASNNDGVWNNEPTSYSLVITPPFWKSWWFFTMVLIILVVSGRVYYNYRIQKKLQSLLEVEKIKYDETVKVRKRVAEDFHDQVGNQLASITVLVQLIESKLDTSNREIQGLLHKLGQFTKTLFTGTRDFIWSIDPKSDKVDEMLIYIRDFGEELFEYSDINFHVDTDDNLNTKLTLPVGWSRHVVYIVKEAMTNSLKHAHCKNVYLKFNVVDHNFVFELKDDGRGLNGYTESETLGMGLRNMKERAKKISGNVIVSSDNGHGTTVILQGKIPQNAG